MIRSRPTRLTQPVGAAAVADRWALRSPVLLASAAHGFANAISGALPALGSTARFLPSVVGVGANGSASSTTSAIGFEDYDFGGTTPITVIAFSDERPGANRSFLAQGTEVILRVSAAGTGVEFILNSFATNDRATAVADSRSSPGFFAAGTYGPSGRLRAYANTAMAEVTPTGAYANTSEIFTAVYTQGLNQLFDKRLALLAIFRSEFSQQELRELSANPWQLFKPTERRLWVPVSAGGAISVTGQSVTQATQSTAGAISQTHLLTGAPCTQANQSGSASVAQTHVLSGQSVAQSNTSTAGAVGAVTPHTLTGADCSQANGSTAGVVTQTHLLAGASCQQVNTGAADAVTQVHMLAGAASQQINTSPAGAVSAVPVITLTGAACSQANTSTGAPVTQTHVLMAAPVAVDHIASASAIVQTHMLAGSNCSQGNTSTGGLIRGPVTAPELGAELSVAESLVYLSMAPGVSRLSVAQSTTYLSVADATRRISVKAAP